MNEQPETTTIEKRRFPLGAIFLIIYELFDVIAFGASVLVIISLVLSVGLAVALFINLKDAIKLALLGGVFLMEVIFTAIAYSSPLFLVARLFFLLIFVEIGLLYLCSMQVGSLNAHKKLLSIAFYVTIGLSALFFLIAYIVLFETKIKEGPNIFWMIKYEVSSELLTGFTLSWISWALYLVALLFIGITAANPYKIVRVGENGEPVGGSESEYFVSLGKHICLLLFTFGIWQLMWIYKMTAFTNVAEGEPKRDPTKKLLLCIFVPFYLIYWTYKTALRIDAIAKGKGVLSDLGTVSLILAIFVPIIPPILLQDKTNAILTA